MAVRAWCFTLNNPAFPTAELPSFQFERYVVWQREVAPDTGTLHLQGYIECSRPCRLAAMKKWLPTAHFEQRRGTREEAADYCKKPDSRDEGDDAGPHERGSFDSGGSGARNDLVEAVKFLRDGNSKRDLIDSHPLVLARYPRFVDQVIADTRESKRTKLLEIEPRDWQQPILDMVNEPPSSRQILWVYDEHGGKGKTYLARYLIDKYDAFYSNGGKTGDIAYAYNYENIVIFDFTRDTENYVNYQCMEALKNGMISCNKYESTVKKFDTPHVIVFANFLPADGKLSKDRLVILELGLNGNFHLHEDPARLAFL